MISLFELDPARHWMWHLVYVRTGTEAEVERSARTLVVLFISHHCRLVMALPYALHAFSPHLVSHAPAVRCPAPNDGGSIVSSCPGQLSAICDSLADPDLSPFYVLSTGENEAQ